MPLDETLFARLEAQSLRMKQLLRKASALQEHLSATMETAATRQLALCAHLETAAKRTLMCTRKTFEGLQ